MKIKSGKYYWPSKPSTSTLEFKPLRSQPTASSPCLRTWPKCVLPVSSSLLPSQKASTLANFISALARVWFGSKDISKSLYISVMMNLVSCPFKGIIPSSFSQFQYQVELIQYLFIVMGSYTNIDLPTLQHTPRGFTPPSSFLSFLGKTIRSSLHIFGISK